MRSRWLIVAIPVGLGLLVVALVALGWLTNWIISVRANLDALSVYAGILLSLLVAAGLAIQKGSARTYRQYIRQLQERATADRNRILDDLGHELKNPLTTLKLEVANLENTPPDCAYQEHIAKVKAV